MTLHIDKYKTGADPYPYEVPDASGDVLSYQSAMDVYLTGTLGFCGCGCPEDSLAVIVRLMTAIAEHGSFYRAQQHSEWPDDGWTQIVLNVIENAKWFEHGSSIQHGWLTTTGKLALEDLTSILEADQ